MAFLAPTLRFRGFPVSTRLISHRRHPHFSAAAVAYQTPPHRRVHTTVITARIDAKDDESRPRRRTRRRGRVHGMGVVARAQQLYSRGQTRQARSMLRSHLTAMPSDARAWLALARMERDHATAMSVFAEGAEHCPTSAHLLHAWAVRVGRAEDFEQSRQLFKNCLEVAPMDGVTWQAYAIMEESAGDLPTARHLFAEGVKRAPECEHLWSAWGALERRQGRHDVAVGYLERAARIAPDHSNTLQMWALSLEQLGDADGAMDLFARALSAHPRSVPTLQAYALFHARRKEIPRARELFERASQADPTHAPVWHAWATMERRERNFARARALFDTGVRADPYSAPMLRAWAEMELELGHIDTSSEWRVAGQRTRRRHLTRLGENLHMLRLLIERRSDDDVSTVMGWLHDRAEYDRGLYERLAERGEADVRGLQDMIARRSASDVRAFADWVEERYESDRQIGTHILNWDITAMTAGSTAPTTDTPREWYQLAHNPGETLRASDERLLYRDQPVDYPEAVYFVGRIASSSGDRTAIAFALLSLSFLLLVVSTQLEERGYVPAGSQTTENAPIIAPPSGVDAYLYDEEGRDEKMSTAGGTITKIEKKIAEGRKIREQNLDRTRSKR